MAASVREIAKELKTARSLSEIQAEVGRIPTDQLARALLRYAYETRGAELRAEADARAGLLNQIRGARMVSAGEARTRYVEARQQLDEWEGQA